MNENPWEDDDDDLDVSSRQGTEFDVELTCLIERLDVWCSKIISVPALPPMGSTIIDDEYSYIVMNISYDVDSESYTIELLDQSDAFSDIEDVTIDYGSRGWTIDVFSSYSQNNVSLKDNET